MRRRVGVAAVDLRIVEAGYLKGYADGREAKAGIANGIAFYNHQRLHQALGYRTPMAVWYERCRLRTLWT